MGSYQLYRAMHCNVCNGGLDEDEVRTCLDCINRKCPHGMKLHGRTYEDCYACMDESYVAECEARKDRTE